MRRFKNILFVINNDEAEASIARAARLAQRNNAKLTLLEVVDKPPIWAGKEEDNLKWYTLYQDYVKDRTQRLEADAEPYRDKITISAKVLQGKKFLEIIRQVLTHDHDLVMKDMAIHKGIIGRVLATDDMHLLRKCPCPVLITKHGHNDPFKTVMAAVDFDDLDDFDTPTPNNTLNSQIMDMSISLASEENSHLHIAHAYQIIGESLLYGGRATMSEDEIPAYYENTRKDCEGLIAKLLGRAKRRLGGQAYDSVNINVHVIQGHPALVIPEQAKKLKADLIVMGTVARTGIPGFFIGNTAETILKDIDCSVLALKPKGFVSPVTPL